MDILYSRFQKLLERDKVTAAQVCKATGVSESTISNLKARGGNLSVDNLKALADYFKVPMEYFISKGDEDETA